MTSQDNPAHGGSACALPPGELYLTSNSPGLTLELRAALRAVEHSVARLNEALHHAMDAGATIELRRRHRLHAGNGHWTDQMAPLVHAAKDKEKQS